MYVFGNFPDEVIGTANRSVGHLVSEILESESVMIKFTKTKTVKNVENFTDTQTGKKVSDCKSCKRYRKRKGKSKL